MIKIKLASVLVDDQRKAREFYTNVLGLIVKQDIPMGEVNWLTVVSAGEADGTELLLEPTGHPASRVYQQALYQDGIPLTALAVDDVHHEYERLKAAGVRFVSEPASVDTATVAILDDTCGNLIQLYQV